MGREEAIGRTTLAAEMLNTMDWLAAKYAMSKRSMRRLSGGAQYVTEEVTGEGA